MTVKINKFPLCLPLHSLVTADRQALPHSQSSPPGAFQVARSLSASVAPVSKQQPGVIRRKPLPPGSYYPPESCAPGVPFVRAQSSSELPQKLRQLPSQDSLISTGVMCDMVLQYLHHWRYERCCDVCVH